MCTRVQIRSLSSLPRTLLRLISYSVAGYSLVMVNSVTVLGTTELSSRPTKEEQKPRLKVSEALKAAHGTVYRGASGSAWSWARGSERSRGGKRSFMDGECWSLKGPCMLVPPPHFTGSLEQSKRNYLLGGSLTCWFFLRQYRGHSCKEWFTQARDAGACKTMPTASLEVSVPPTLLAMPHAPVRTGRMQVRSGYELPPPHNPASVAEIGPPAPWFPPSLHLAPLVSWHAPGSSS